MLMYLSILRKIMKRVWNARQELDICLYLLKECDLFQMRKLGKVCLFDCLGCNFWSTWILYTDQPLQHLEVWISKWSGQDQTKQAKYVTFPLPILSFIPLNLLKQSRISQTLQIFMGSYSRPSNRTITLNSIYKSKFRHPKITPHRNEKLRKFSWLQISSSQNTPPPEIKNLEKVPESKFHLPRIPLPLPPPKMKV